MQDDVLRQVEQFLYREARLLDSRQFRQWIDLLADDLRYWIPMRSNRYSAASKSISILDGSRYEGDDLSKESDQAFMEEDKGSLRRRVDRLDTGMAWAEDPHSRTRHLISNVEVEPGERAGGKGLLKFHHVPQQRRNRGGFLRRQPGGRAAQRRWQLAASQSEDCLRTERSLGEEPKQLLLTYPQPA